MATYAEVWIELFDAAKGGRSSPISVSARESAKYRPHLRVHNGNGEYLGVEFVSGPDDPILPGSSTLATVRFACEPQVDYSLLVEDAEFDIMEGEKVVGVGRVTRT